MSTYTKGEATRVIVLRSDDFGTTWLPVDNASATRDSSMEYAERDAERIILMSSPDLGVTWNPITDPTFTFVPTQALDPATASASDIVTALIAEGLLLPPAGFLLLEDGFYLLLEDGTSRLQLG